MRQLLLVKPLSSPVIMNTLPTASFELQHLRFQMKADKPPSTREEGSCLVSWSAAAPVVIYPEKQNSLADSHSAKLPLRTFEKQKVVDPGKRIQSAVKNDQSWQHGLETSLSHLQHPQLLLAVGASGGM